MESRNDDSSRVSGAAVRGTEAETRKSGAGARRTCAAVGVTFAAVCRNDVATRRTCDRHKDDQIDEPNKYQR